MKHYIPILLPLLFSLQLHSQPVTKVFPYSIEKTNMIFKHTFYGGDSSIIFLNLHENENTSVVAAHSLLLPLKKYCLVQLQHAKTRNIRFSMGGNSYEYDPNRMFTDTGTVATIKQCSRSFSNKAFEAVRAQAHYYLNQFISNKKLIIALHNNTEGPTFSIQSYINGNEKANAEAYFLNIKKDPDDFFLTTENSFFDWLKNKTFNVVLQNNKEMMDDGSLSVYCGIHKIPYINIEAQNGHLAEQKKMIQAVLEMIKN